MFSRFELVVGELYGTTNDLQQDTNVGIRRATYFLTHTSLIYAMVGEPMLTLKLFLDTACIDDIDCP